MERNHETGAALAMAGNLTALSVDFTRTPADLRPLSDKSAAAYASDVRGFNSWLAASGSAVSVETIREYFETIRRTMSGATLNRKRSALIAALRRSFADNPALRAAAEKAVKDAVRPVKVRRGVDAALLLSPSDVEDLAAKADARLALMVRFLWATGCRVSELCAVRLRDVKTNGMAAIRLSGKGNKERLVKVPVELYAAIRETFNGKVYLFETSGGHAFNRSNIHKALKRLGGDKVRNPHTFRHSRATWLIKNGVSLTAVSALLGHSDVSITAEIYVHDAPDFEAIAALDRKAAKAAHA